MSLKQTLLEKIQKHEAVVGVIGLGYVGLPLVLRFSEESFTVLGFDIDEEKVEKLNAGQSYIKHIPSEELEKMVATGKFEATSDFSRLVEADCIVVCVPTPLKDKREPDMRFIEATSLEIVKTLRRGQLISLESTTYPGTTREILLSKFEGKGLIAGEDFFLAFSPEREDPGNPKFTTKVIPKVVGGITAACREVAVALYDQIVVKVIPVSSPEVAEFTKLLENIFRAVNIALVNEMKILADRMGVDIWEIIEASSTKPFGFMPFYPGPGLGGHCIPIDPFYLSWKAREYNFNTQFIELAGMVNTSMPQYVVHRIQDALNVKGKSIKGSKILILGVAYKSDTDDIRESPAVELMDMLQNKGAQIFYNDPHIPEVSGMRHYDIELRSSELTEDFLRSMNLVLIATAHAAYDYDWIVKNAPLIVDTRNATKNITENRDKIVKA